MPPPPRTLSVRIVKRSDKLLSYTNAQTKKEMMYFNAIGLTGQEQYQFRIYQRIKFDMVATGRNIKLKNAVDKGDTFFLVRQF